MADQLRIVTADDSYLVREGARRILEDSGDVVVLAAVGSASELLQGAVRSEIRRQDLLARGRVHAEELQADVGEPTTDEQERADVIARRLVRRPFPGTGR